MGNEPLWAPARQNLIDLLGASLTLGVIAAGLSWLGAWYWRFELLANLRSPMALVLGVALGMFLALRAWRWSAVMSVGFALAGGPVGAEARSGGPSTVSGEPLRLYSANVLRNRYSTDATAAAILAVDPDVIVLLEVDDRWLRALAPSLVGWPHRVEAPRPDNFGVAVYSRVPFAGPPDPTGLAAMPPEVTVELLLPSGPARLTATHPPPPVGAGYAKKRDEQLMALADRTAGCGRCVVAGDLNITPFSPAWRPFIEASGLLSSRGGRVMGTWPAGLPGPLMIPLDHILVGPEVGVESLVVGEKTGSDHHALIAELVFPDG